VLFVDDTGCIREVNPAFEEMIGPAAGILMGRSYLHIVHPSDTKLNQRSLDDLLHGKRTWLSLETRFLRRDKSFFWGKIYVTCAGSDRRKYAAILVIDISRQKEAEAEVRHLSAVSCSIHDTTIDIMNRLDYMDLLDAIIKRAVTLAKAKDGYIYIVNEENQTMEMKIGVGRYEKAKMFQVHIDEGFGGKIWKTGQPIVLDNYSVWPASLPDNVFKGLRAAMGIPLKSGGHVTGVITISSDEDGRGFSKEEVLLLSRFASLASIALDNSRLFTALKQEIDERKRAEEALYESTELVRTILRSATDLIYVKDRSFQYVFANPVLSKLVSMSSESIIGKKDIDLYPPEVAEHAADIDRRVLSGEVVSEEIQIPIRGNTHVFEYIKVPLRDKGGSVAGICGISRDITERKKTEAAMLEAKETVARAEKLASLGTLAAGVTHEINQPLNSIKISATGILYWYRHKKKRPMDEIMEEVEVISSMADRIDRIIKHMRALARSSKDNLELGPCDLNKIVGEALDFLGSQLASHGIRVQVSLANNLPPVLGPPAGLEEAVINLLANAMQALDAIDSRHREVAIRTERGANVILEISDNGPGIMTEIMDKVLDPFFTTKGSKENMGFGLSITNSIVTSCGGKIRIISDGVHGSIFQLEFPIPDMANLTN
jgi:PAS domain S-box-containing protein